MSNNIYDIRNKKKIKPPVKAQFESTEKVSDDIVKVINKHLKKKTDGFDIALALTDVAVQFIYDTAPSSTHAQHMLVTAMQETLEQELYYMEGECDCDD